IGYCIFPTKFDDQGFTKLFICPIFFVYRSFKPLLTAQRRTGLAIDLSANRWLILQSQLINPVVNLLNE
ncbi:MAG: hypothetical protein WD599_00890, partial [Balneolaceae bacterium]